MTNKTIPGIKYLFADMVIDSMYIPCTKFKGRVTHLVSAVPVNNWPVTDALCGAASRGVWQPVMYAIRADRPLCTKCVSLMVKLTRGSREPAR